MQIRKTNINGGGKKKEGKKNGGIDRRNKKDKIMYYK